MTQEFTKTNQAEVLALAAVYLKDGNRVTLERKGGKWLVTTEKVEKEVKKP